MANNFESLECWLACNELKNMFKKKVLHILPPDEKYELYSQIRRASRSSTANIAEGWGKFHYKEQARYLYNARGSVAELLDHTLEARNWNYISEDIENELRQQIERCLQLISGYIRYLKSQNKD